MSWIFRHSHGLLKEKCGRAFVDFGTLRAHRSLSFSFPFYFYFSPSPLSLPLSLLFSFPLLSNVHSKQPYFSPTKLFESSLKVYRNCVAFSCDLHRERPRCHKERVFLPPFEPNNRPFIASVSRGRVARVLVKLTATMFSGCSLSRAPNVRMMRIMARTRWTAYPPPPENDRNDPRWCYQPT